MKFVIASNATAQPAATPLSAQEFDTLRVFIESESGIALGGDKQYLMESRLKGLLPEFGCQSYGDLLNAAKANKHPLVRQKIIDAITTNETLWFRDKGPFVVMNDVFLPLAVEKIRRGFPKIRIWSAACSTGQETYSIAMVIHDFVKRLHDPAITTAHFEIVATDISSEALSVAQLGAYDRFSIERGLDAHNRDAYFKQNQSFWIIDPSLKRIVQFKRFNLLENPSQLGPFDCVFLRNVAIYFSTPTKLELIRRIRSILHPQGAFFLGSTESLSFVNHDFQVKEHQKYVYYQVPG
jgi:chemotaxis protein methyltransferase CheR